MAQVVPTIPPYGMRKGWVPRKPQDFGDGGAFPEINLPQYPLEMGLVDDHSNALSIPNNADDDLRTEILLKQGHDSNRVILGKPSDVEEQQMTARDKVNSEERAKRIDELKQSFDKQLQQQLLDSKVVKKTHQTAEPNYILYTPAQKVASQPIQQRLIKMIEMPMDPMEPPRFQINKKIPRGPPSPPPAILASPPRPVSKRDKEMWKIPPCVSNWKNPRGYTVPLANRVAADGRNNQVVYANDKFNTFSEALFMAERKARDVIKQKNMLKQKLLDNKKKEESEKLQQYAARIREKQAALNRSEITQDERERNELRHDRQRERNRERNMAKSSAVGKSGFENRDISEQIALGQANPLLNRDKEDHILDKRLFDKSGGLDSGFSGGADDLYNIYDKPLFNHNKSIYRAPRHPEGDPSAGGDLAKYREDPNRQFISEKQAREQPVSYEKDDPFMLNEFLTSVKATTTTVNKNSASTNKRAGQSTEDESYSKKKR